MLVTKEKKAPVTPSLKLPKKKYARSGAKTTLGEGPPPVLVVWDPAKLTNNKITIDFTDPESLKLWVLNRIHIYFSNDGKEWLHRWGNFEGCLTGRKIFRTRKGATYRKHVYLRKKVERKVLFATLISGQQAMVDLCKEYPIDVAQLETRKDVHRPYPEGFEDSQKKFDWGIFRKGINILKIPAEKVNYPARPEKLEYWELKIYRSSLDHRIGSFRDNEKKGILKKKEISSLRSELENKRGRRLALYKLSSQKEKPELEIPGTLPDEETHCYFYGVSRDVIEERVESKEEVTNQLNLYRMDNAGYKSKTKPISLLEDFSIRDFFNNNWMTHATNSEIRKTIDDKHLDSDDLAKHLLGQVKFNLESMYGSESDESKRFIRFFSVGIDSSREGALLLAISNVVAREEYQSSTYNYFKSSTIEDDECTLSAKRVSFATGSDNFSEEIIPRHIYVQIQDWWENLYDYQKEELQDTIEIEVMGFSSKLGESGDNERLRKDRAWKTAKCLQMFLENTDEFSNTKFNITAKGYSAELESIYIVDSGSNSKEIPIFHGGMPLEQYPGENLFNTHELDFIQDVLDEEQLSVPDSELSPRDYSNNQIEDRVSLIVFKKPRPKSTQIAKQYVILNTALVIHEYKLIYAVEHNGMWYVLIYVCPGLFDDEYPGGFGSMENSEEKYVVQLEVTSEGYFNSEFVGLYTPEYEDSEEPKPFVNAYSEPLLSAEGNYYYTKNEVQHSLSADVFSEENLPDKYLEKEMEPGHSGEEDSSILPVMFLARKPNDPFYDTTAGKIRYLSQSERQRYEVTIKEGKLFLGNQPLDTMGAEGLFARVSPEMEQSERAEIKPVVTNTFIFAMTPKGTIYTADWVEEYKKGGYYDALRYYGPAPEKIIGFNHSSFTGGRPIAAAGEITVKKGELKLVSNKSGHYFPKPIHIYNFLCELHARDPHISFKNMELELMTTANRFQEGEFYNAEEFFKARGKVEKCKKQDKSKDPKPDLTDGGAARANITRIACLAQVRNTCGQRAAFNAIQLKSYPGNPRSAKAAMADDRALRAVGQMQVDVHDDYIQEILDRNNASDVALISSLDRVKRLVNESDEYPNAQGEQNLFDWAYRRRLSVVTVVINTIAAGAEVNPQSSKASYGHYIAVQLERKNMGNQNERLHAYYADSLAHGASRSDLIQRLIQALTPE